MFFPFHDKASELQDWGAGDSEFWSPEHLGRQLFSNL